MAKKRKKTISPWIVVRNSKIHGKGIFAKKDIPENTRIIEYVGLKVNEDEADRLEMEGIKAAKKGKGAIYCFELTKKTFLNGEVPWNTARNMNHTCDPNCESDIIKGKVYIFALRDIKKGEELSYNYGYDMSDLYKKHLCKCRSNKCVGYILDEFYWPKLKRKKARAAS